MPTTPTTPKPSSTLDECDFEEQSAVFARSSKQLYTAPPAEPSNQPDAATARAARIEAKIAEARAVIAKLDPEGLRARLLRIAVVRRDEVLLSGMLRSLKQELEPESRERTTILPPPERKS